MLVPGCADGLHSLRGPVRLDCSGGAGVSLAVCAGGRALLACGRLLLHVGLLALGSALRRAPALQPELDLQHVQLPSDTPPHFIKVNGTFAFLL